MGTPLSPTPHPAQWDVPAVCAFLAALAPSQAAHAPAFRTHGIAGDVLLALDAQALRELGVRSVGQRLVILTAVWRLKQEWGIALDDGEWRPSCECRLPLAALSAHLEPPPRAGSLPAAPPPRRSAASVPALSRPRCGSGWVRPLALRPRYVHASLHGRSPPSCMPRSTGLCRTRITWAALCHGASPDAFCTDPQRERMAEMLRYCCPRTALHSRSPVDRHRCAPVLTLARTAHDLLSSSSSSSSFPSTAASSHSTHVSFAAALRVRDERIRLLEGEVSQLAEYLSRFQHDFAGVCRMLGVRVSVRAAPPMLRAR